MLSNAIFSIYDRPGRQIIYFFNDLAFGWARRGNSGGKCVRKRRATPAYAYPGPTPRDKVGRLAGNEAAEIARDMNEDEKALRRRLEELLSEHRDLDDVIAHLIQTRPFDQLQIQRLKKRKLSLKDQIARVQSRLLPDIIA